MTGLKLQKDNNKNIIRDSFFVLYIFKWVRSIKNVEGTAGYDGTIALVYRRTHLI